MSAGLLDSVDGLPRSPDRERSAWAAWRDHAVKARFSAVMGTLLSRNMRPSTDWDIRSTVHGNDELTHALWGAAGSPAAYDTLHKLVVEHCEWCLQESESGILPGIREGVDPHFSLFGSRTQSEGLARAEQERDVALAEIEAKLALVCSEAEAFESSRATVGMGGSRQKVLRVSVDSLTASP